MSVPTQVRGVVSISCLDLLKSLRLVTKKLVNEAEMVTSMGYEGVQGGPKMMSELVERGQIRADMDSCWYWIVSCIDVVLVLSLPIPFLLLSFPLQLLPLET